MKSLDILDAIERANRSQRTMESLNLRVIKLSEEHGELSEAFLNARKGEVNPKNKCWEDVLEEACDVAIVALDIALTIPPTYGNLSVEQWKQFVEAMIARKLLKWVQAKERDVTTISPSIQSTESGK